MDRYAECLRGLGYRLGEAEQGLLESHCALIREWNGVCSLVSQGDLNLLWERHVLDSLRVACCLASIRKDAGALLDIGSGGGFPGIVSKTILPDLHVTLLERSAKKVGFLRRVVGVLGLHGIDIVCGEFPAAARGIEAQILTARAIENPKKVSKGIAGWLGPQRAFLCQTAEVADLFNEKFHVERVEKRFHVEQLQNPIPPDPDTRGNIYIIRPEA